MSLFSSTSGETQTKRWLFLWSHGEELRAAGGGVMCPEDKEGLSSVHPRGSLGVAPPHLCIQSLVLISWPWVPGVSYAEPSSGDLEYWWAISQDCVLRKCVNETLQLSSSLAPQAMLSHFHRGLQCLREGRTCVFIEHCYVPSSAISFHFHSCAMTPLFQLRKLRPRRAEQSAKVL